MTQKTKYIPMSQYFVELISSGYSLLDENSREKIHTFISSCQNIDGGFNDRAHQSDLYYSMFGFWMSSGLGLRVQVEKFKTFISRKKLTQQEGINAHVLKLIQVELNPDHPPEIGIRDLIKGDRHLNFSYRVFILLLLFDSRYGEKSWLNGLVNLGLRFYGTKKNIPCSMLAALMVARHKVGLKTSVQESRLYEYFDLNGFKSFQQAQTPDMLSTAVALFALWYSCSDIRVIAPACLEFIQDNFDRGAFLSGDGDETRDLEYTFYGLLSLGTLARNQEGNENK